MKVTEGEDKTMKEKQQAVRDACDNLIRKGEIEEIWYEGEDEPRYRWIPISKRK